MFNIILDYDSTVVGIETLDYLVELSLSNRQHKAALLQKFSTITEQGMRGDISFSQSLSQRFQLMQVHQNLIAKATDHIQSKISQSLLQNMDFIKQYRSQIYIVSNGFIDLIQPVAKLLGIADNHIFANRFIVNQQGCIAGYDSSNVLTQSGGKAKVVAKLKLARPIFVIGDGVNDYNIVKSQQADYFIAYTEFSHRQNVVSNANFVANNFDEAIRCISDTVFDYC